jgi:hypothetical protein
MTEAKAFISAVVPPACGHRVTSRPYGSRYPRTVLCGEPAVGRLSTSDQPMRELYLCASHLAEEVSELIVAGTDVAAPPELEHMLGLRD